MTSYARLFQPRLDGSPLVTNIEIPSIQRDYAQGRTDERASKVRSRFLDVLHTALTGKAPVSLDFVYGSLEGETLHPLDGQQRLTTVFLLHWYLGYRAGELAEEQPWMKFSYATRPSARLFCERLVRAAPAPGETQPTSWIVDQPWYLYVWQQDPTIQAMLVMIQDIHERFADCDGPAAWKRLAVDEDPAISFLFLPVELTSGEDLYIKMNSRGKPLTAFENFKALFECAISWSGDRATAIGHRIDGAWTDVLWRFRGDDDIIDDEFLRYFSFITDVCQWQLGQVPTPGLVEERALRLFGTPGDEAEQSLNFLTHAFDTWASTDVREQMAELFTRTDIGGSQPLVIFGADENINLLEACCRAYDDSDRGRFTYSRTLLLLAVLLDRMSPSGDFPRRVRVLRNLIEGSDNELRPQRMPALVADVRRVIVEGSLEGIKGFNQVQVDDEQQKLAFLQQYPDLTDVLFRLEDHPLLRGSLQAFDLDPATLPGRAASFEVLMASDEHWLELTGALLAAGDYSRRLGDRDRQFGAPHNAAPWRRLLAGESRSGLASTASALGSVLDAISAGTNVETALRDICDAFARARVQQQNLDWRYYLVQYDVMREGWSGIYASVKAEMGYAICMLNRARMNGYYRDPYLSALVREAEIPGVDEGGPYFIGGYVDEPRWFSLPRSGTRIRNAANGFELLPPEEGRFRDAFDRECDNLKVGERYLHVVPQQEHDGSLVDLQDRVASGADLLRRLLAVGL
ncbi:DUF262 domain-containing protein [Kineosporia rhizophila]|uniref:DUF262 domain-containing protein n=1 Tax=Kineosporia rhizophila TaxID=84633 RepID=UPI001E53E6E4|nr:DUF262 domain-containing protein [Kineosporia rhizophila]